MYVGGSRRGVCLCLEGSVDVGDFRGRIDKCFCI